ncbi:MAG: PIG-L family deacetylase, partial [Acidobacteriia bacterium]|nr:PIG-L family deacetylase [Terriglobia bacterium]
MRWTLLPILTLAAHAQTSADAYESLLRLRTTATVLHITAHPDDEDGALLTWLARSQGVRTGLFTLTRGEGGANLIGPELFDALGLVRTEELLASDRAYGVDQFFSRAADFGFSKRLDETLEHWGKDTILRDAVRVVRLYRPDVIIARFHGTDRDGHGNHQAAGLIATEVFKAAADPNLFPEQLREGLRPWQPKKFFRSARPNEPGAIPIQTGAFDPVSGMSPRQIAAAGLSFQRSQGHADRRADAGPAVSSVIPVEPAGSKELFDTLDTTLSGLAQLAPSLNLDVPLAEIEKSVARAIQDFDARDPSRVLEPDVVPALRNLRAVIRNVSEASIDPEVKYDLLFRLRNKEDEFMRAVTLLAGIAFEVASPATAIPGEQFKLAATFTNRSAVKLENVEIGLAVRGGTQFSSTPAPREVLGYNEQARQEFEVVAGGELSRPYWSRKDEYRDSVYAVNGSANLPYAPPAVEATESYAISGVPITIVQPVPLAILPAVSVALDPRTGVIPASRRAAGLEIHARVVSNAAAGADAKVHLEIPEGWVVTPPELPVHFSHRGEVQTIDFHVTAPQTVAARTYALRAVAESGGKEFREGYQAIAHADLRTQYLYRPAEGTLHAVELKVAPNLKIGYIAGAGDDVAASLEQIGIKPQIVSPADNLALFDTIIIGIREYSVRSDLRAYGRNLLDYVRNGGNLIVQYQTDEFEGPFPLQLGRAPEEVSEEEARVAILDPSNAVFASPNKITPADFDGWVEERGSKFMASWDPQYKALLESHDRGQAPQKGGLLQARYGKGTFTYCAYAFYRQLPAGVPGAYRLFANLISIGKPAK